MTVAAVPLVDACNACNTGSGGQVIPVDIACTKAVAIARPVEETECLPLLQACGRVLARDTASPLKLPPFDNSAMDGYAVRHAAFAGRGPWRLRVAGTVRPEMLKRPVMRHRTLPFESSPALPFPRDSNAVIMQERCERTGDDILVEQRPQCGRTSGAPGKT